MCAHIHCIFHSFALLGGILSLGHSFFLAFENFTHACVLIKPTLHSLPSSKFPILYHFVFPTSLALLSKPTESEAREVARWLGAVAALAKDPGLTSSIHAVAHSSNSRSRGSNSLFCLSWTLCAYGAQTYMQVNTPTPKMFLKSQNPPGVACMCMVVGPSTKVGWRLKDYIRGETDFPSPVAINCQ